VRDIRPHPSSRTIFTIQQRSRFFTPNEIEEIEWMLALGSTNDEEEAMSPGPKAKSGVDGANYARGSVDVVERSG